MNRKRILFILEIPEISVYHRDTAVGGVCFSICRNLCSLGHEVFVNGVAFNSDIYIQSLSKQQVTSPINKSRVFTKLKRNIFAKKINQFLRDCQTIRKLKGLEKDCMKITKPDIVISWIGRNSDVAATVANKFKSILFSIYDNPLEEEFYSLHNFKPFLRKYTAKKEFNAISGANQLIVYCPQVAMQLNSKYHLNLKYAVKQFTDDELMVKDWNLKHNDNSELVNLIYVGSFLTWHRLDNLIEVIKKLNNDSAIKIKLHLIGVGLQFDKIKKMVGDFDLGEDVLLYGYKNGEELTKLLQNMDIGIIPGCLWFHAPVKFMQYLSAGLILISPDTPVTRILSNKSPGCFLFEDHNEIDDILKFITKELKSMNELRITNRNLFIGNYSAAANSKFWNEILS
jgi:glycosyltransferase involved in cell wall biosynthesis